MTLELSGLLRERKTEEENFQALTTLTQLSKNAPGVKVTFLNLVEEYSAKSRDPRLSSNIPLWLNDQMPMPVTSIKLIQLINKSNSLKAKDSIAKWPVPVREKLMYQYILELSGRWSGVPSKDEEAVRMKHCMCDCLHGNTCGKLAPASASLIEQELKY